MSNKPNSFCLHILQKYSARAWVYRAKRGWVFARLTRKELAEFRSYQPGITLTSMRVRPPRGVAFILYREDRDGLDEFANCFVHCTLRLPQARFQIPEVTGDESDRATRNPLEPKSYEAWLWADEIKFYRRLGYEITVHGGYGWREWISPSPYKKHVCIYAIVNDLTQEVYVGQTENVERRWVEHRRDAKNPEKVALIQNLRAQGHEPEPIKLEEVSGEKVFERERYWTSSYKRQGYKIINRDYRYL